MNKEDAKDRIRRINALKHTDFDKYDMDKSVYDKTFGRFETAEKRANKGLGAIIKVISFIISLLIILYIIIAMVTGTLDSQIALIVSGVLLLMNYDIIFKLIKKWIKESGKKEVSANEDNKETD